MESATCRCPVDRAHELTMLARDEIGITVRGCRLEPLRERLDRRAVAEVLETLPRLDPDALALLLDVRHSRKRPQLRAGRW